MTFIEIEQTVPQLHLTDVNKEYQEVWDSFSEIERPVPHRRDLAAWASDKGLMLAILAKVDSNNQLKASALSSIESVVGLEILPKDFVHIVLQSFGFSRRLHQHLGFQLSELKNHIHSKLENIQPFDISLGGMNTFHSAIFTEVRSPMLMPLRQSLQRNCPFPIDPIDLHHPFIFHATDAFYEEGASVQQAKTAIVPFRHAGFGTISVDQLSLVAFSLSPERGVLRSRTIANFPLAGREKPE